MENVVFITDVPTPYRVYFFNQLDYKCKRHDINLSVNFMSSKIKLRNWVIDESDFNFNYKIYNSIKFQINNFILHLNIKLIFDIIKLKKSNYIIIGGSWNMPTSALLLFLLPILGYKNIYFWSEANNFSSSNRIFYKRLRRFILKNIKGFLYPGRIAFETINTIWGFPQKKYILLTNLIDEISYKESNKLTKELFCEKYLNTKKINIIKSSKFYLIVGRFYEYDKGIINFLEAVYLDLAPTDFIFLVGDGPDKLKIEFFLQSLQIENIIILGWINPILMPEVLKSIDVFVLPSYRDPYPLSLIEAIWSGCPLLISNRCGNYYEVLQEGINGFSFDPYSKSTIQRAFKRTNNLSNLELYKQGIISLELAQKNYNSNIAIESFLKKIASN